MRSSTLTKIIRRAGVALSTLAISAFAAVAEEPTARKVVVELFTSQGCSSCPPADALLGELAKRPDVIALSMHVDYWDYLGWKDRFASKKFGERQVRYAASLGARRVYTPQMIIQGAVGMVGNHREATSMAIERQAAEAHLATIKLVRAGDALSVAIKPTKAGAGVRFYAPLDIVAVGFDGPHELKIGAGENTGAKLVYHHVARDFRVIGAWSGGEHDLSITIDPKLSGYAVFVQHPGPSRIVAAEQINF
ncbi:MAG: DUF1223 domain-containing protein [Neomegalonema sp.]|nr:DUF1223 domain-containing protein [Neomegalonema sp.]